jgi:hypothetical protein
VSFCFNAGAGADLLLVAPSGQEVGIEISTRAPRGLDTLATDIYLELRAVCADVKVHLFAVDYPPVSIRATDRQRIFDRVIQVVCRGRPDDSLVETAIRAGPAAGATSVRYRFSSRPGRPVRDRM